MKTAKDLYGTSARAEVEGAILDCGGFWIQLARAGGSNREYQRELEKALRPHRLLIEQERFTNEMAEQIIMEVYSRTVVKAWGHSREVPSLDDPGEAVTVEDPTFPLEEGVNLPLTPENALRVFQALPDLFQDCQKFAGKPTVFRAALEAMKGNS